MPAIVDVNLAQQMKTHTGESLDVLSQGQSVLLIFLRHLGCVFCREALYDLAKLKSLIKQKNIRLVLVHMANPDEAESFFAKYGLSGVDAVSDPQCQYYESFGLLKGDFRQLYGLKVWMRGFEVGLTKGIGFSTKQIGDGFQMPGVFLVKQGKILDSFIHKSIADKPDYSRMINCCE